MIKASINDLQTIYSERNPYEIEARLGNSELIIFDIVFIDLLKIAFEFDCVNQMSEDELTLLYNFIKYEDGTYADVYVAALDVWLVNLVNGVENPIIEGCGK